jgi:hypothetical protein
MVVAAVLMRHAGILAEDQRLDGNRHGVRRHADAPEVDVVEVAQGDAVDDEQLRLDPPVVLEDAAERVGDIAIENEIERLPPFQRVGQLKGDGLGERR